MSSVVVADTAPEAPASPLSRILAETITAARTADRDDLVGRLEVLADRIRDPAAASWWWAWATRARVNSSTRC